MDLSRTMSLNDKIDYIYWDDPNEIVDRLRLLEASRQADYNGHDNEDSVDYRRASRSQSDYKLTSFYTRRSVDIAMPIKVWIITWRRKRIALSMA